LDKDILFLLTILESIEKIFIYTKNYKNANTLFNSHTQKDFNAVINLLIVIGESCKKISLSIKKNNNGIPWYAISGMRNEFVHNYQGIDKDIVWDIVKNHLNPLKKICVNVLKTKKINENILGEILSSSFYKEIQYLKNELYKK
jgi:uncharacterized protein with HEPN domain